MSIVTIKEIGGDNIHLEEITVTGSIVQERLIEHTSAMGVNYFPGHADYAPATVNDTLIEIIDRKADISQALPSGGTSNDFLSGDKTWKPVTKNTVGLNNVDNTSDLDKPISNATQNALNDKENIISTANPAYFFAGDKTWKPVTKNTVGLDQLTNHTQLRLEDLDTDVTLSANSDSKIPSQKAVKTFVDTHNWDAGIF